jgi:hypothetical protein
VNIISQIRRQENVGGDTIRHRAQVSRTMSRLKPLVYRAAAARSRGPCAGRFVAGRQQDDRSWSVSDIATAG